MNYATNPSKEAAVNVIAELVVQILYFDRWTHGGSDKDGLHIRAFE